MLSYLSGLIKDRRQGEIILAVGNDSTGWVGYQVRIPEHPRYDVFIAGERAEIYIHSHIREDAFDLYGFINPEEKNLFHTLLSVSGVGPKLGMGLLSHSDAPTLVEMILTGDKAGLTNISGVGKKTAERIVLELKDPIEKKNELGLFGKIKREQQKGEYKIPSSDKLFIEAYLALQGLGFKEIQAKQMVERAISKNFGSNISEVKVEDIIRCALQTG